MQKHTGHRTRPTWYDELAEACEFSREELIEWSDLRHGEPYDTSEDEEESSEEDMESLQEVQGLMTTQIVWRYPEVEAWFGITYPERLTVFLPQWNSKNGKIEMIAATAGPW